MSPGSASVLPESKPLLNCTVLHSVLESFQYFMQGLSNIPYVKFVSYQIEDVLEMQCSLQLLDLTLSTHGIYLASFLFQRFIV